MTPDTVDEAGLGRAEDRLQDAVRAADVAGLDALLHDDLLATGPDGRVVTKQEDVAGYAAGTFRVDAFEELERRTRVFGTTGVTLVLARVTGRSGATPFDVRMRYTRTWAHDGGRWRVVAAHLNDHEPEPSAEPLGGVGAED
jgi:ketosteroid isomerase-like protein